MPIMPSTSERRPMTYTTRIGSTDKMTAAIMPGMSIPNWLCYWYRFSVSTRLDSDCVKISGNMKLFHAPIAE